MLDKTAHGLRFDQTQFWIRHRSREYGPFDYEWSRDLGGVELTYCGEKFGEYCGPLEIYADLKSYSLPKTVVEVGSIVLGCVIYGILNGLDTPERGRFLNARLHENGYDRFTVRGDANEV
ncbi:MAG: hypothetical protein ACE5KM_10600 [Planctomycetaceae bacterium]